jgi:hypothetical protein
MKQFAAKAWFYFSQSNKGGRGRKNEAEHAAIESLAAKNVSIRIRPYTEAWSNAVTEFNCRVRPANAPFQLPETPASLWLSKRPYQEVFLAVEEGCVRGAYTFKHQEFSVGRRILEVGMCRMPISEGIVDKRNSMLGVMLIKDAVRKQPLLYNFNLEVVVARMVLAMGAEYAAYAFVVGAFSRVATYLFKQSLVSVTSGAARI